MYNPVLYLLTFLLTVSPLISSNSASSTQSVSGVIILDGTETIEIWPAKDKSRIIALHITPESYIADAVSGKPASISERKGDAVVAYYKTDRAGDNRVVALIINIPEDFSPPVYARAAQVSRGEDQIIVWTDKGVMVTISVDTPIEPFLTRDTVTIDDININTDLLLWNQAYNMSIPARTAANQVVILGKARQ